MRILPVRSCARIHLAVFACAATVLAQPDDGALPKPGVLVDHSSTDLAADPAKWIEAAKDRLVIAYGHTSHGSQLVDGLQGLEEWKGAPYTLRGGAQSGGLDLRDTPFRGASDLGNPDHTAWVNATRTYLKQHPEVNVVMWSWCGQVSGSTEADIAGGHPRLEGVEFKPAVDSAQPE